jgi:hypothetical protein
MRRALVVVFGVLLGLLSVAPVLAGLEESRTWYEALPEGDREGIQYDLTLLGHYTFIIDKQFGTGTYDALIAYQKSQGYEEDGVLDQTERDQLFAQSDVVYRMLGLKDTRDELGKSQLVLPAALLSEVTTNENGTTYASPDGGIMLETLVAKTQDLSFSDLFAQLNASASGFKVMDASYNASRFVVMGTKDGRSFYTMYENADVESVGYSLSWDAAHEADAAIIKIFIASYFIPLRFLTAPDETQKASSPGGETFGPWSLPADVPDAIALNGEIGDSLVTDWEKAIAARPTAKYVLLNSPGGYVDYALVVARQVAERKMSTFVAPGAGCYSACSYIFFAGASREVDGELGVHQISAEVADLVLAQTTLADVLAALDEFQVTQKIITVMLQTPPADMYIFTSDEVASLGINRGDDIEIAFLTVVQEPDVPADNPSDTPTVVEPTGDVPSGPAFVMLAIFDTQEQADKSLKYATDRWAGVLGNALPELAEDASGAKPLIKLRVPAPSMESANSMCSAIKTDGGGCYVTPAS